METLQPCPPLELHDAAWPIRGDTGSRPPPRLMSDPVTGQPTVSFNSVIDCGCELSGTLVRESVLYPSIHVEGGSVIENSILLPGVRIGADCRISNTIVAWDMVIPAGTVIGENSADDRRRFLISEGDTVVARRFAGSEEDR